jgi:hypothetical protein
LIDEKKTRVENLVRRSLLILYSGGNGKIPDINPTMYEHSMYPMISMYKSHKDYFVILPQREDISGAVKSTIEKKSKRKSVKK